MKLTFSKETIGKSTCIDPQYNFLIQGVGTAEECAAVIKMFEDRSQLQTTKPMPEICLNAVRMSECLCKIDGRECSGNDSACEDRKLSA